MSETGPGMEWEAVEDASGLLTDSPRQTQISNAVSPDNISKENVTSINEKAWALYVWDDVWVGSPLQWDWWDNITFSALNHHDRTSNDTILIASSTDSVYNLGFAGDNNVKRYYAIGDPVVGVSISHNAADPAGEFFKCDSAGPHFFGITSADGKKYCMPVQVAIFDNIYSHFVEEAGYMATATPLIVNFPAQMLRHEMDLLGGRTNENITAVLDTYHFRAEEIIEVDHGYSFHDDYRLGLIPSKTLLARILAGEYVETKVPYTAEAIETIKGIDFMDDLWAYRGSLDTEALTEAGLNPTHAHAPGWYYGDFPAWLMRTTSEYSAGVRDAYDITFVSEAEELGYFDIKDFDKYDLATYAAAYAETQPAREDEYAMVLEDNKASVEYKKNLNGFDVKFDTGYNLFSEYKDYEINLNVSSKF